MTENLEVLAKDVRTPFSADRFSLERKPEKIGFISPDHMRVPLESCLDMLVKLPRRDLTLPPSLQEQLR